MGKKKKKAQPGAWADEEEGEALSPAPRGKAGRRQLSRKQLRRATAAAWEEGSDGEDQPAPAAALANRPSQLGLRLPLSDLEGVNNKYEEPGTTLKHMTPRSDTVSDAQHPTSLPLPSPEAFAASLARSSGSFKAFGPPLRYPSCDTSPQVSARLQQPSPPLSARLAGGQEAAETSSQQASDEWQLGSSSGGSLSLAGKPGHGSRLQRPSALGLSHASIDVEEEEDDAEQESGNSGGGLQRQQLAAAFAVLAASDEEEGAEDELAAAGEEGQAGSDSSSVQAVESTAGSFSFGGALAASPQGTQVRGLFSFAAAAGASPAQPSPQQPAPLQGRSRFAFAAESVPAGAEAATPTGPASLPLSSVRAPTPPLFNFAAMAAAASPTAAAALGVQRGQQGDRGSGGPHPASVGSAVLIPAALSSGSSEEDAFFSAAQSRATSAALTAYASAVSLSRSGGDSPTRSSAATPLRVDPADPADAAEAAELCGESIAAAERASAGAAPAPAFHPCPAPKGPPSVLEQLQQTAWKLSAAAEVEAGAAEGSQDAGEEEEEELAAVEDQPREQFGWPQVQPAGAPAPVLQPSPFAGESFMAAVSLMQPNQAALSAASPPSALSPVAAATPAAAVTEAPAEPELDAAAAVADPAAASMASSACSAKASLASVRTASPAAASPAAQPAAARPLLFAGSPLQLAAGPAADAAGEGAAPETLSQMAPWSPKLAPAWQQSPKPAGALAQQSWPQPVQQDVARGVVAALARAPAEESAPASVAASAEQVAGATAEEAPIVAVAIKARVLASAPTSPALPLRAAEPLQPPATAPALGRSLTRHLVRTLTAQRESDQSPRLLLQEAQRHLLHAFEMLPSTSALSGAASGWAERQPIDQPEALQDSDSSGSCAGSVEPAPADSECSTEPTAAGSPGSAALAAAELAEQVGDAERGQQLAAACEAAAGQHPAAANEPDREESNVLPAGGAVPGEEPGPLPQPAATEGESLFVPAVAVAAVEADAAAADEGEEEAAYSLKASAAGSSDATEADGLAETGAGQEGMADPVEHQLAEEAEAEAAAAIAEQEVSRLQAASAGAVAPPYAAAAECSRESLVAAVAAEQGVEEEDAETGQERALQVEAAASSAAAAGPLATPSALSGGSNNLQAAAPAEPPLCASVASSAVSSADGKEGEEEQSVAAATLAAASLAQPAAAEASCSGCNLRASVSSLASTAGSDEAPAAAAWAEDVSTGGDLRASAASVGSGAATSGDGSNAAELADEQEQPPGSDDEDMCSSSSCAAAHEAACAAPEAAPAEDGVAGDAASDNGSEEAAVEEAAAGLAAEGEASAAALEETEDAVAAEVEEAAVAGVDAAAEEGQEAPAVAEEGMRAAMAAQLVAVEAKAPRLPAEHVAEALMSPAHASAGVEDSLEAAVPAVVPAWHARREASAESLVLHGSVCTLVQPEVSLALGQRLPPLPMVDPLAAASDMPSARRQPEAAATATSPPSLRPEAAGEGLAQAWAAACSRAAQQPDHARFPAVDLAAAVDPAALQPPDVAAGDLLDAAGRAVTAPAALMALMAAKAVLLASAPTQKWEGMLTAAAAAASSCSGEEGEAAEDGRAAQHSPLLLEHGWLQRSDSPLWGPQEMLEVAAAAAQTAASPPGAAGLVPGVATGDAHAPGPLQGGLQASEQARAAQQQQRPPPAPHAAAATAGPGSVECGSVPAPPLALRPLGHAASGAFVSARSRQSDEDNGGEQAGEEEAAPPSTEHFRHLLAHTPGARSAHMHCLLEAAAQGARGGHQGRPEVDGPGVQAGGSNSKLGGQTEAGLHGQKQRLLQGQEQFECRSSGIKAAWGQPAAETATREQAAGQERAQGSLHEPTGEEQQPAALDVAPGPQGHRPGTARPLHAGHASSGAAGAAASAAASPSGAGWQWKGLLTPRSCPASELAAEAAAAAAAGGAPVQQRSPGTGSEKKRRQPQAASSRAAPSQAAAARRLHGGSPSRLLSPSPEAAVTATPGRTAAAAMLFAAAAAVPESPMVPTAVPPLPAQLSPESLRYRQSQPQTAPSVQQAPGIGAAGQHSPDSQRFKQQAAQTSVAVSQLQLRRLMSERHPGMQAAAPGEDELEECQAGMGQQPQLVTPTSRYCPPQQQQQQQQAGAETPRGSVVGSAATARRPSSTGEKLQEQQQPLSPGIPAAVISARLAQAEQLTPISALRALRSSLALMAGTHGTADRGATWSSQQNQMQGLLERVETRFREAREQAQQEAQLRHKLEQEVFALKQRVEELEGAAEEAETLRLDLMEARREVQELQHRQHRWQAVQAGEEEADAEQWQPRQQKHTKWDDRHSKGRQQGRERWEREQAAAQRQQAEEGERRMAALLRQHQQRQLQRRQQEEEARQAQLRRQQEQEAQQLMEAQRAHVQRREAAAEAQLAAPAYPAYPYDRAFRPAIQHNLEQQEAFYYGARHAVQPVPGAARPRSAAQAAAAAVAGTLPQQSSFERGTPLHAGPDLAAAAASQLRHQPLPRQYATIGVPAAHAAAALPARTAGGREQGPRHLQPQQQAQRKAANLLDARAFTPLGAGAAGLLRGERQAQQLAGRHDGAGYDPRQYHTMF